MIPPDVRAQIEALRIAAEGNATGENATDRERRQWGAAARILAGIESALAAHPQQHPGYGFDDASRLVATDLPPFATCPCGGGTIRPRDGERLCAACVDGAVAETAERRARR